MTPQVQAQAWEARSPAIRSLHNLLPRPSCWATPCSPWADPHRNADARPQTHTEQPPPASSARMGQAWKQEARLRCLGKNPPGFFRVKTVFAT